MKDHKNPQIHVGDKIRIIHMDDCNGTDPWVNDYNGRIGIAKYIDSLNQIHGSWGGLALQPEHDIYELVK